MREQNLTLRLLRLFPLYREMEKKVRELDEALDLSAAAIRSNRLAIDGLRKKTESDASLIESLNRYIEALEAKAACQDGLIKDLKRRLKEIIAGPKYWR